MFVRKRPSGNQLLESYREGGKSRQRVIFNLGHHETPEAALTEAETELEALQGKVEAAEARVDRHVEEWIKPRWQHGLEEWHDGEIPTLEDVIERARGAVLTRRYGDSSLDPNLQHSDYAQAFVGIHGDDLSEFIWDLRNLEDLKAEASAVREDAEPHAIILRNQIELLRGVVFGSVVSE